MKRPPERRPPHNPTHQATSDRLIPDNPAAVQHRRSKVLPELVNRLKLYREAIEFWRTERPLLIDSRGRMIEPR